MSIRFCIAWLGLFWLSQSALVAQTTIERGGMTVRYEILHDSVTIELSAPTHGWLAIGFNDRNHIVGTDLKMLRVIGKRVEASDRLVQGLGVYPSDEALGGEMNILMLTGKEQGQRTTLSFRLPLISGDPHDMDLRPGQSLWLIMAYSAEDDFGHHSRMREHVQIKL
jgi:hypothetical protein